jgi:hypothetical protein
MIKDAIANIARNQLREPLSRVECHCDSGSIIDRFSEVLFASDVPSFVPRRGRVETESAPVPLQHHGRGARCCDEDLGCQILNAGPLLEARFLGSSGIGCVRKLNLCG